jgi:intracellular septation protein A
LSIAGRIFTESRKWLQFLLRNFAAPAVFIIVLRIVGPRPAIASAVAATVAEIAWARLTRRSLSPIFLVASGFTILFGTIDMSLASPRFFRLEPFIHNVILAGAALGLAFAPVEALRGFADALPQGVRPEEREFAGQPEVAARPQSARAALEDYLRKLALVWSAYFLAKSLFFLELSKRVDLGQLVALRTLIGGSTLVLMVGAEILYRKKWRRRAHLVQ